jgi:hypothetical protein
MAVTRENIPSEFQRGGNQMMRMRMPGGGWLTARWSRHARIR